MSGYRDDTESLKAEIERLRAERASLDRRLGLGPHASTPFGRAGYRLGRRLALRLARRRPRGPAEAAAELLRARREALEREIDALERVLLERGAARGALSPPPRPPDISGHRPDWAERMGRSIARALRRWRRR